MSCQAGPGIEPGPSALKASALPIELTYCIIYVWKIIEGLVPNFSKPIVCSYSERRERSCIISHVNLGRLGSLAYNSFRWRAIRLFNAMPMYIRYISSCCCCLPTPMTLASGGSPMFPLVVHQPASPSIWPAVQSLRRGLSTNPGATMWCVCGCS